MLFCGAPASSLPWVIGVAEFSPTLLSLKIKSALQGGRKLEVIGNKINISDLDLSSLGDLSEGCSVLDKLVLQL